MLRRIEISILSTIFFVSFFSTIAMSNDKWWIGTGWGLFYKPGPFNHVPAQFHVWGQATLDVYTSSGGYAGSVTGQEDGDEINPYEGFAFSIYAMRELTKKMNLRISCSYLINTYTPSLSFGKLKNYDRFYEFYETDPYNPPENVNEGTQNQTGTGYNYNLNFSILRYLTEDITEGFFEGFRFYTAAGIGVTLLDINWQSKLNTSYSNADFSQDIVRGGDFTIKEKLDYHINPSPNVMVSLGMTNLSSSDTWWFFELQYVFQKFYVSKVISEYYGPELENGQYNWEKWGEREFTVSNFQGDYSNSETLAGSHFRILFGFGANISKSKIKKKSYYSEDERIKALISISNGYSDYYPNEFSDKYFGLPNGNEELKIYDYSKTKTSRIPFSISFNKLTEKHLFWMLNWKLFQKPSKETLFEVDDFNPSNNHILGVTNKLYSNFEIDFGFGLWKKIPYSTLKSYFSIGFCGCNLINIYDFGPNGYADARYENSYQGNGIRYGFNLGLIVPVLGPIGLDIEFAYKIAKIRLSEPFFIGFKNDVLVEEVTHLNISGPEFLIGLSYQFKSND